MLSGPNDPSACAAPAATTTPVVSGWASQTLTVAPDSVAPAAPVTVLAATVTLVGSGADGATMSLATLVAPLRQPARSVTVTYTLLYELSPTLTSTKEPSDADVTEASSE